MTKKARKQSAFTGAPTMASPQQIAAAGAATAEVLARMDAIPALKGTVSLMELNGQTCRWPIGDPTHADFGYCGDRRVRGAYCEAHANIAYLQGSSAVRRKL
jgi:GcrA cell cycle regulator